MERRQDDTGTQNKHRLDEKKDMKVKERLEKGGREEDRRIRRNTHISRAFSRRWISTAFISISFLISVPPRPPYC